jgi:hypothetical protein
VSCARSTRSSGSNAINREDSDRLWNVVVRDHEEILRARQDREAASDRFGSVEGYDGRRLPAPPVPEATITPRRNPPRRTDKA